jgi:hypothetical protein
LERGERDGKREIGIWRGEGFGGVGKVWGKGEKWFGRRERGQKKWRG